MASASDNFNRANSGSLGPNWNGGCQISGNVAIGLNGSAFNVDWYTAVLFASDHYSECAIAGSANADNAVAARVQDAINYYMLYNAGSGGLFLFSHDSGGFHNLNSFGGTVSVGDMLRLWPIGTSIHCYKNGVELSGSPIIDGTLSGGSPGIVCFGNAAGLGVNNWSASDGIVVSTGRYPYVNLSQRPWPFAPGRAR